MTTISLTINNEPRTVTVPPLKRLLDVLREDLHLTGAKEGCGEGECGSCSVLMDTGHGPELVNSCLVPILQAQGAQITTIEGLTPAASQDPTSATGLQPATTSGPLDPKPWTLDPVQQHFLQHGGAQCGICTPGMILATHHLLTKHPHPTLAQIQEGLAGNLCRCTGYMRIFEAVQKAAEKDAEINAEAAAHP